MKKKGVFFFFFVYKNETEALFELMSMKRRKKRGEKNFGRPRESNSGLLHPKQEFYHLTRAPPYGDKNIFVSSFGKHKNIFFFLFMLQFIYGHMFI